MQRRNFIKNTILTSTGLMLLPPFAKSAFDGDEQSLTALEKYFINPPLSARPWVFWMWMNGNITKAGITADLEAMKRMGIGGVINFNSAVGIVRGPVDYASEVWMEATAHAVREADRLGIVYSIHNSPGYSGCGGPWVTPEMSMQQLVWTESLVHSNGEINMQLPRPYFKQNYYRDAFVIAYPSLPAEKALMKDKLVKVLLNGNEIDKAIVSDRNPETKIRLEINESSRAVAYDIATGTANNTATIASSKTCSLVLEFSEPFEARAVTIYRKPETPGDLFDGPRDHPTPFKLEYSDDSVTYRVIGTIRPPELREMDTPAALSFNAVKAKYYRLTVAASNWLSEVELHNGPRLGGWPGKTSNTHGDINGDTPVVEPKNIIDPVTIIDLSDKLNADGRLRCKITPGKWTILRIGHTTTGEECAAHPDAGAGLEIDKFRKEALQFHFDHFLDKFINKVKPYVGKTFKAITVDSYEAGKQNWTINFDKVFKQQKGYDLIKWLPALTGRIIGSVQETEKVLWDVRRVQADLLSENFYGHYKSLCHQRGLEFYAEPYGDGNMDSLQIGQHLDITMSEFWTRYIYGSDMYSKQAVSAAHIYGKKIVAAEAYTAMPATSKWTDYPFSLKAEGDYFFSLGVNRLVFHTFVHQPYMTGKPGMTMGPFGMHIDRNNTWTEQAYGWTNYLQRSQYLLQQGLTVADVCYFKGNEPQSGVPDIYKILPMGYHADVIGPEALQKRLIIKDTKIILPDGMSYRICVMAALQQLLPSSLNKIKKLVSEGMVLVVSNKPVKTYGNYDKDSDVQGIADELYGDVDGKNIRERSYGKGKIIWSNDLAAVLKQLNIKPDFKYTAENNDATIHYAHKKIGADEFYFISNHKRRDENILCSFRVNGKQPEIWNSETGKIVDAVLYDTVDGRIHMPVCLQPAGSLFIVFRKKISTQNCTAVTKNGYPLISTSNLVNNKQAMPADVKNNFTVCIWAKPDTFAHPNKSMLFHAPEGEMLYGSNHVAIGLSAGQNAVRVYERGKGNAKEVLAYNGSIEGWTHIALSYENGKPSLYLNGKLVAQTTASGKIVHSAIGAAPAPEQFASYFEGNNTMPDVYRDVLSEKRITNMYAEGFSSSQLPGDIEIFKEKNQLKALIWKNGEYTFYPKEKFKQIANINGCNALELHNLWKVQFPKESGAPAAIVLPFLTSLHKHENFDVKHFSGTCTYSTRVVFTKDFLQSANRFFLHLGRVEAVAEVKVNGKKIGLLWKEPFIIEITNAIKTGNNLLEIAITNLWPNRLIGDEHLPIENEYSDHKFIKKLPDWYVNNQPKPGQRKGFAVWKNFSNTDPLLESGLLGPVKIITAIEKDI